MWARRGSASSQLCGCADAVEDHPRLRLLEDRRAELLPEPISGYADRRFHRSEQVEVGVPRSQLVSDGLDEVARAGTRLRLPGRGK